MGVPVLSDIQDVGEVLKKNCEQIWVWVFLCVSVSSERCKTCFQRPSSGREQGY